MISHSWSRQRLKQFLENLYMEFEQLRQVIERSWACDTVFGEWDAQNPSAGQCAVTALVIQDYFGGELLKCPLSDGGSHYWNLLPNGDELDFTEAQFTEKCFPLREQRVFRERSRVLAGYDTELRYAILRDRVKTALAERRSEDVNL